MLPGKWCGGDALSVRMLRDDVRCDDAQMCRNDVSTMTGERKRCQEYT